MEREHKGLRFNSEKPRYDLIEPFAQLQKAQIFTKGARKYAPHNWLRGMSWSSMLASAKRHIAAFEMGQDYDIDPNCPECKQGQRTGEWVCKNHTGELHVAQAAWNLDGLTSFYKWYPQGDDRQHRYLNHPKIGLDIDEVLCDWVGGWIEMFDMDVPKSWFFDRKIMERFEDLRKKGKLNEFYLNLKPKVDPNDIPFEPHCYVTSRPVDSSITEQWLDMHGFPSRPVYTVKVGESKVDVIKNAGVEIFIDDRFDNFVELNNAGICTFLWNAEHNSRYDVGYKRIYSFKNLSF